MKRSIAILIDDDVFLQHILGLVFALIDEGYNPHVITSDSITTSLTAIRILKCLDADGSIKLAVAHRDTFASVNYYDLLVSQWGPPPNHFRRLKHAKNTLLHSFRWKYKEIFAFPHGFEIKCQSIQVSRMSVIRSILINFSSNPFEDYNNFYTKYFFETSEHEKRYSNFLSNNIKRTIGFVTFNQLSIERIRRYINDKHIEVFNYPDNILIMPKLIHVNDAINNLRNFDGLIFLHPREFRKQKILFKEEGTVRVSDTCLDYFALQERNTVYDFGTSVCLLAKVMGSKVIFENKLKTDLIYHPDQFDKLASENFFTNRNVTYQDFTNYLMDEIGLSNDE